MFQSCLVISLICEFFLTGTPEKAPTVNNAAPATTSSATPPKSTPTVTSGATTGPQVTPSKTNSTVSADDKEKSTAAAPKRGTDKVEKEKEKDKEKSPRIKRKREATPVRSYSFLWRALNLLKYSWNFSQCFISLLQVAAPSSAEDADSSKSKRTRVPVQPYQAPLPDLFPTKVKTPAKSPVVKDKEKDIDTEKLVIFYKYVYCQLMEIKCLCIAADSCSIVFVEMSFWL